MTAPDRVSCLVKGNFCSDTDLVQRQERNVPSLRASLNQPPHTHTAPCTHIHSVIRGLRHAKAAVSIHVKLCAFSGRCHTPFPHSRLRAACSLHAGRGRLQAVPSPPLLWLDQHLWLSSFIYQNKDVALSKQLSKAIFLQQVPSAASNSFLAYCSQEKNKMNFSFFFFPKT